MFTQSASNEPGHSRRRGFGFVFAENLIAGTRYANGWATALGAYPIQKMRDVMLNIELHNRDVNVDPAPSFATDAEIEFAERLRDQLEERYLAPAAAPTPVTPLRAR
jgi:hypothetical protein